MKVINNKATLIPIIIGLALSFILLVTSIVLKIINYGYVPYVDPNPTHELLHDGVLYFYDKNDKQIGTYTCKPNFKYCGLAYETIDDGDYNFRAYSDDKVDFVKQENNRYAFIVDSETAYEKPGDADVILYDFKKGKELKKFSAVKNYTIGLDDNIVFVKEINSGWRILILKGAEISYLTDYTYKYVSVHNTILQSGRLDSSNIVTYDGNLWQLINDIGSERTTKTGKEIIDYNNNYIIYRSNNLYQLQTLSEYSLLNGYSFKQIKFIPGFNTYAELINVEDEYYIADYNLNRAKTSHYSYNEYEDLHYEINKNREIEIVADNQVLETIK